MVWRRRRHGDHPRRSSRLWLREDYTSLGTEKCMPSRTRPLASPVHPVRLNGRPYIPGEPSIPQGKSQSHGLSAPFAETLWHVIFMHPAVLEELPDPKIIEANIIANRVSADAKPAIGRMASSGRAATRRGDAHMKGQSAGPIAALASRKGPPAKACPWSVCPLIPAWRVSGA